MTPPWFYIAYQCKLFNIIFVPHFDFQTRNYYFKINSEHTKKRETKTLLNFNLRSMLKRLSNNRSQSYKKKSYKNNEKKQKKEKESN